jgi:hypothetical protein
MTDIRSAWTVENYTAPDGVAWRIAIFQDTDADSPRSDRDTNMAELLTSTRSYHSPDHENKHADPVGVMEHSADGWSWTSRMRGLYLAARTDVVGWAMLDQNERDGSLSVDFYADSSDIGTEMHDGVAYIMRDRWDEMMGADYDGPITPADVIRQEVELYNTWCEGGFCGFVVEHEQGWQAMNHDGTLGEEGRTLITWEESPDGSSCWGFDSEEAALEEARTYLPVDSVKV